MTSPNLATARIALHRLASTVELVEMAMASGDWVLGAQAARQCSTLANDLADALAGARTTGTVRVGVDHGR